MRVLTVGNMYPPHHLGGYELMWRSSVEHLRRRGHEVRVLTTDYRSPDPVDPSAESPDVHRELRWYWREHRFPPVGLGERLALERHNAAVMRGHLREHRPDTVSWWAMGGMSLSLIERVRRLGMPALGVVVDDWMVYGTTVDAWQRAARRLGRAAGPLGLLTGVPAGLDLDRAAEWVFVSEAVRRRARDAGWRLPGARVVNAGIDRRLFAPRPRGPWRGRLLYLGRLDPRKGVHVAIAALEDLPEATLEIVGDGDPGYRAELERNVRSSGVGRRVRFSRRPRAELPAAYAEADAVLFPTLWDEPWGLVPLEAMSVGTPVIATGSGGSGEYLRDGRNCLLYGPGEDPAALSAAVRRLADDESLRAELMAGGFATAARFTEPAFNDAIAAALTATVRE